MGARGTGGDGSWLEAQEVGLATIFRGTGCTSSGGGARGTGSSWHERWEKGVARGTRARGVRGRRLFQPTSKA